MKKFLKWLGIILGVMIVGLILAIIMLTTLVSPNRFKPYIIHAVKNYTGRDVTLEGDLSWTFYPSAGIKVKNIQLANPPEFKNPILANIKELTVLINLPPLLDKKIESSGVIIDGMQLHLIENAQGKRNWEIPLPEKRLEKNEKNFAKTIPAAPSSLPYMVAIAGASIKDASISYVSEISKKNIILKHVNIKATNFSLISPFEFKVVLDYELNSPRQQGHIDFKSDVVISLSTKTINLPNMNLTLTMPKMSGTLLGEINIDVEQDRLQADNLQLNLDGIRANLTARMIGLSDDKRLVVQAEIPTFDLSQWLSKHHYLVENIVGLNKVNGRFTLSRDPALLTVRGTLNVDSLVLNQMKLTEITTAMQFKDEILSFAPFTANFYQGKISGNAEINLKTATPQIKLNTSLRNINLGMLSHNSARLKFEGKGDVDLLLNSSGISTIDLKRHANGQGRINILNGVLVGLDVNYLLETAIAFVEGRSPALNNSGKTPFINTTASFNIDKGILYNKDLSLLAKKFESKGQGTVDLVNSDINYQLQTYLNKADANSEDGLFNLYGLPIPIKITGDLQAPRIGLDRDVLIKSFASQQLQKVKTDLQNKIKDKKTKEILNKLFGH